jgi:hypothetical protein
MDGAGLARIAQWSAVGGGPPRLDNGGALGFAAEPSFEDEFGGVIG